MIDRLERIRRFYEEAFYYRLVDNGLSEEHARVGAVRWSTRLSFTEKID